MKRKILLLVFSFVLVFSGCHSIYKKNQVLSEIDDAVNEPHKVFIYRDSIYFSYEFDGKHFYLSAKLPEKGSRKSKKNVVIQVEFQKGDIEIEESGVEEVSVAKDVLPQAIEKMILDAAPEGNNRGIMMLTDVMDVVLYKDAEGKIIVSEPANVPKSVVIKGKLDKKYLRKHIYGNILELIGMNHQGSSKFIMPVNAVPSVPYVYIDTEKDFAAAVKLPDYYQIKKDISTLGFSVDILYSFFIKSHVFALIKSPFTSAHRLFSTATYSVFSGFSPQIEDIKGEIPPINEKAEFMDIKAFERALDFTISDMKYKGKAELLIDGNTFFPDFIEQASLAQESINVHVYIFKTDPYSLTIADLLKKRSNEGIKVKVLTDEINTVLNWTKDPKQIYSKDYVMPSIKKYLKENSKVKIRTTLNTWVNVDHRKKIIIDDKIAYIGGMNFGEEYRYFWHDMMLSLSGPIVAKLNEDFKQTWTFAGVGGDFSAAARSIFVSSPDYSKGITSDMYDMRVLYTRPTSAEIFNAQIEAIKRSRKRIYVQNPYFSDVRIIQELINARGRGVDVRVILPTDNDVGMMNRNNMVKANIMFRNGIKVYFFPRMSHIKAAIYDNWACVGSANFDKMSLYICNEMSLGISDPGFVEELDIKLFQADFEESELMEKELELSPGDYIMSTLAAQG